MPYNFDEPVNRRNTTSEINKSEGGILIESPWLQLRQRRKHQVFQIYAVNDWREYVR